MNHASNSLSELLTQKLRESPVDKAFGLGYGMNDHGVEVRLLARAN
jgi:hypothetical protein